MLCSGRVVRGSFDCPRSGNCALRLPPCVRCRASIARGRARGCRAVRRSATLRQAVASARRFRFARRRRRSQVLPSVQNRQAAVRNLGVKALGLACLLSKPLAAEHFVLFMQVRAAATDRASAVASPRPLPASGASGRDSCAARSREIVQLAPTHPAQALHSTLSSDASRRSS